MVARNGSANPDILVDSDADMVGLVKAVWGKVCELREMHVRYTGVELVAPVDLKRDFELWKDLSLRHQRGDRRHKLSEKKALRTVAQWSLDMFMAIRNQQPQQLHWKD